MKRFWKEIPALLFLLAAFGVGLWIQFGSRTEIPLHFNARGEIDRWASLGQHSFYPRYGLLTWFQHHPRNCNYPVEITDENREQVYRRMSRIICHIKVLVMALFLYITLGVGQVVEVSILLVLAFALAILYIVVTGWSQMDKNK